MIEGWERWEDRPILAPAARRRRVGRLAGGLYLLGALSLVPSTFLIEPAPGVELYLLTALGAASGIACLLMPWDRLSPAALHLPPIIGSIEIALVVWALGEDGHAYLVMLVIVAVWSACVFRDRRILAGHLAFAVAAVTAAIVLGDELDRMAALELLVSVPVLVVAAAFVALARREADARELAYKQLAERDPLTGVGNYRALRERLDYEVKRHARHGRPFALFLMDLDGFKRVNDRHGHLVGDGMLRRVAEELMRALRVEDTVTRQGGDEFAVLAPEIGPDDVEELAERMQARIGRVEYAGESVGVTVGWACFPANAIDSQELLLWADAALRERKRADVAYG